MIYDQKLIRRIILLVIILIMAFLVYFVSTHGRVNIVNPGDKEITVIRISNDNTYSEPVEVGNGSFISSGNYVISNTLNNSDRLAQVSVPRWLGETKVTFSENPSAQTTKIAALTYENIFQADNGALVSFTDLNGYVSGYSTHPTNDAFGGDYTDTSFKYELNSPVVTNSGQLLGINHQSSALENYSFKSNNFTSINGADITMPDRTESENNATLFPKIQRSSNANSDLVGIYEKKKNVLKTIDGFGSVKSYQVKINNPMGIVFDINETSWAAIETTATNSPNSQPEDEETKLDYTVTIGNKTDKKTLSIPIGQSQNVSNVALAPSGKFVAVVKDGELWVYEVSTKRVVMLQPLTLTNQLIWIKDKLYSLTTDTGISVFDTNTRQLLPVSVNTDNNLSFSNTQVLGSKLYVTAYNTKNDSELPDGFVIDLDQKSNGITEELAKKLPYSGKEYDINYLNNTIYIRVNYFPRSNDAGSIAKTEAIKKEATTKVNELLTSEVLKNCTVVYIN